MPDSQSRPLDVLEAYLPALGLGGWGWDWGWGWGWDWAKRSGSATVWPALGLPLQSG